GAVPPRFPVLRRAGLAAAVGYAVSLAAAALTCAGLRALGAESVVENTGTAQTLLLGPATLVIAVTSAAAGAIMIVSLRDIYVVGSLIGLVLIPAAAIAGCAAVSGDWSWRGVRSRASGSTRASSCSRRRWCSGSSSVPS